MTGRDAIFSVSGSWAKDRNGATEIASKLVERRHCRRENLIDINILLEQHSAFSLGSVPPTHRARRTVPTITMVIEINRQPVKDCMTLKTGKLANFIADGPDLLPIAAGIRWKREYSHPDSSFAHLEPVANIREGAASLC